MDLEAPVTSRPLRWAKRPRLSGFNYIGANAYHLVTVTAGRRHVLEDGIADDVIANLHEAADRTQFEVLLYVVMPDHVHVLVSACGARANVVRFMQRWKQLSGYAYARKFRQRLWQPSLFDRVIRRDEDIRGLARYIAENPLRAQLISSEDEWAYCGGSLVATTGRS
jgi:REP element-mobilizing transposase RayT